MIAEVDGKYILNQEKWYRCVKRGEKGDKKALEKYLSLGGAVMDTPKKVVKKVAKKTTKKKK